MNEHLQQVSAVDYRSGNPQQVVGEWVAGTSGSSEQLLAVDFELASPWLDESMSLALTAVYLARQGEVSALFVTDRQLEADASAGPVALFAQWQAHVGAVVFKPGQPLALEPLSIPKPWGQEIWYTGIERRGVCNFVYGDNRTPIPWLQAAVPGATLGPPGTPPVLLKILDPSAEPVTGDLYFELHEQKREVYVVTHVEPQAWPDGVGAIRYGFDAERVAAAGGAEAFRAEYLAAVQAYERIRREIDALPQGVDVPADLVSEERRRRSDMDAYTSMMPLQVGDVVRVPLLLPHSLQHGVRTVEFQTPVYERRILSFAQKVLTQDHWDTAEAVQRMTLVAPPPEPFEQLVDQPGIRAERIVDFEDFEVARATLAGAVSWEPPRGGRYALVMVIAGRLRLPELTLGSEQAALLPADSDIALAPADSDAETVILVASPRR